MVDDTSNSLRYPARASLRQSATVSDLSARRREEDVISSITLVFGDVNYGTIPIQAPYAAGKPFALYLVRAQSAPNAAEESLHGPLDCLITDDVTLALDRAQ